MPESKTSITFRLSMIDALIAKSKDQLATTRCGAVKALAPLASNSTSVRQALVERLNDPDDDVKFIAIEALGPLASENPDVRLSLVEILEESSFLMRFQIVKDIIHLAVEHVDVREAMARRLNDEDQVVQYETIWNLVDTAMVHENIRQLIMNLRYCKAVWTRDVVAVVLGKLAIEHDDAGIALIEMLGDESEFVRDTAVSALTDRDRIKNLQFRGYLPKEKETL